MNHPSPYYKTEEEHARAFEKYWKDRGVDVRTEIEPLAYRQFTAFNLRSDLVLRVPRARHRRVYGTDSTEIKMSHQRKWQ